MEYILILIYVLCTACIGCSKVFSGTVRVGKLNLSPIGCGTWAWGNRLLWGYKQDDDERLRDTFNYVVRNGVNWFDTADSYGTGNLNGRSETLLGEFLDGISSESTKQRISICTKLAPYPWRIGQGAMETACKESVERLHRPLDMLQLHWPPVLGWQETEYFKAFKKLTSNGSAKQVGLSNYGPKSLRKAVAYLDEPGAKRVFSNQVKYPYSTNT